MEEVWKPVVGYEGLYEVSNMGRVKSLGNGKSNNSSYSKERILKGRKTHRGYLRVNLYKNNKAKDYYIHRLVAEAFIPNIDNLPCINHKDENPKNNHVTNLEWVTYKENNNYGTHNEKVAEKLRGRKQSEESNKKRAEKLKGRKHSEESIKKRSKPVIGIDRITGLIVEFTSIMEASRQLGINSGNITKCCKGKYKSMGGFYWYYADTEE